jgi:hypothetical protein
MPSSGRAIEVVIDVDRQRPIGCGVVERLSKQHLLDRVRRRLRAPGAGEILGKGFAHEASQRDTPGPGSLRGPTVQIRRKEELGPTHV